MEYKLFEVGGHVRDNLLKLESKDIDYSVVINDFKGTPEEAFNLFCEDIENKGFEIFLKTLDCFTVRAKFPESHEVADFVIARKEVYTDPYSRTPEVFLGSLQDDLERRDFTVNTLAVAVEDGYVIDLFGGVEDLYSGILRTPKDTFVSFNDDPLRVLRAIRFKVTKEFDFSDEIYRVLRDFPIGRLRLVSEERIREELLKCFKHDTAGTLKVLYNLRELGFDLLTYVFEKTDIWLEPTNKK